MYIYMYNITIIAYIITMTLLLSMAQEFIMDITLVIFLF